MIGTMARAWDRFWFDPVPVTSVCLYRIGLGVIAIGNGILYIPNFDYWFGPNSVAPLEAVERMLGGPGFGLFLFYQPNNSTLYVLLALYILFAVFLTIGLWTRFSTIALWFLAVSFRHRNPFFWHSVDFLLILMLQLLIFAPAGARFSVDALLQKKKTGVNPQSDLFVPWTQRLMQVQLTAVYFRAFWGKVFGETWWQGTAVYYATRCDFIKFGLPPVLDNQSGYQMLTWGTLVLEFSLFSLIWLKPFRYWVLSAGVIFHALINWSLDLDFLEHIMVLGYINFIYPQDLQRALSWTKARATAFASAMAQPKSG